MNNKEFIQSLIDAHAYNVSDEHGEINEHLLKINALKEVSDDLLDEEKPDHYDLSVKLGNSYELFEKMEERIDSYRFAYEKQQEFLSVVDKIKDIDFSKIPIKFFNGVKENYENNYGTSKIANVIDVTFSNDVGFDIRLSVNGEEKSFQNCWGGFDTKDPKVTALLNEAGFYTYDQSLKLEKLHNIFTRNKEIFPLEVEFLSIILKDKDGLNPATILDREFEAFAALESRCGFNDTRVLYNKYKDLLPVPIDRKTFWNISSHNYMGPVMIVENDGGMEKEVIKRATFGNCTVDFFPLYSGSKILNAEIFFSHDYLTVKEQQHLKKNTFFESPSPYSKMFFRNLSYEIRKFNNDAGRNNTIDVLSGPEGNTFIRNFLKSPEMKETLSYIPMHCRITDSFKPSFQNKKKAQR